MERNCGKYKKANTTRLVSGEVENLEIISDSKYPQTYWADVLEH